MENGINFFKGQIEHIAGQTTALQAHLLGNLAQVTANLASQSVGGSETLGPTVATPTPTTVQPVTPQPNLGVQVGLVQI